MAVEFTIRDFCYPLEIYRLRRAFEGNQWRPEEELRAFQERRLSQVIDHAYSHVPYYRRLFEQRRLRPSDIRGLDDLRKLPLLSKDDVREAGMNLVAGGTPPRRTRLYRTSGSTGVPLNLYLDKHANALEFVYYWRHWSWAGYKLGDPFAELETLYFLRHRQSCVSFRWQPMLRRLLLNSGQVGVPRAKEMAAAIRRHRPRFLKGMASSLYFLALSMKEAGIADLAFVAVFSTGEVLTEHHRRVIADVFHCPILDSYGHMERTVAISQCPRGGYHIHSDYGVVEFDRVEPSPAADTLLGRVVGTSLYNRAMPFIRYEVGDTIELFTTPQACPCGRTFPIVKAIHGRSEDVIVTPDGRFITSIFVLPELTMGIRLVQFVQESAGSLSINVVPDDAWNEERQNQLLYYTRRLAGPDMTIRVHRVRPEDITRDRSGKIRVVISRVSQTT